MSSEGSEAAVDISGRRPIKARNSRWAAATAARLDRRGVSPNAISDFSVVCALVAAACLIGARWTQNPWAITALMVGAVAGIQGRLLCNLFDGMVAVEGKKAGKAGEVYNDFPDRLADPIILIAAGYAAVGWHGVELGWLAGILAVMTAYVRVLGRSIGAGIHFLGPMAKQHRMAVMTAACLLEIGAAFAHEKGRTLWTALIVIDLGCVVTIIRRLRVIVRELEAK